MKIEDAVFGPLESSRYTWQGSVYLESLDKTLPLEVDGSETYPPDEAQQSTFTSFLERQFELKTALERAVLDYYTQEMGAYRAAYGSPEEAHEWMPDLHEPSEVWTRIEARRIEVGSSEWGEISLSLAFNISWDVEHGMDVTFFEGKMGIAEGGANWLDQTHYDLTGTPL